MTKHPNKTVRARDLRQSDTPSEGLLWSALRAKQLCGLKFRREHPIGPFFADFACPAKMLVVEVDGGYHDFVAQSDSQREAYLREKGWEIIRFNDEDVTNDIEAVSRTIAGRLGLEYEFRSRDHKGSGMKTKRPK